jgi:hypothetical protein
MRMLARLKGPSITGDITPGPGTNLAPILTKTDSAPESFKVVGFPGGR